MTILSAFLYVHLMHAWCLQSAEEAMHPLELELQKDLSCIWVLGAEPLLFAFNTLFPFIANH